MLTVREIIKKFFNKGDLLYMNGHGYVTFIDANKVYDKITIECDELGQIEVQPDYIVNNSGEMLIYPDSSKKDWVTFLSEKTQVNPFKKGDYVEIPGSSTHECILVDSYDVYNERLNYIFSVTKNNILVNHYCYVKLKDIVPASEEKKKLLDQSMKDNGYSYRENKLFLKPLFEIGDYICVKRNFDYIYRVDKIDDSQYTLVAHNGNRRTCGIIEQKDYRKFSYLKEYKKFYKPFEHIISKINENDTWHIDFFESFIDGNVKTLKYDCVKFVLPYNLHTKELLGTNKMI